MTWISIVAILITVAAFGLFVYGMWLAFKEIKHTHTAKPAPGNKEDAAK